MKHDQSLFKDLHQLLKSRGLRGTLYTVKKYYTNKFEENKQTKKNSKFEQKIEEELEKRKADS